MRKAGPAFDLAIALALIAIDEQVDRLALQEFIALGELALDGTLQPVNGILPMVLGARNAGFTKAHRSAGNAAEAALVDGIELYAVDRSERGCGDRRKRCEMAHATHAPDARRTGDVVARRPLPTCADSSRPKRALEIAAAGGHNLLLVGPPGCGKTMLARRLPSILPPMTLDEALDVTKIYSVAGLLTRDTGIVRARPFRFPHHTISQTALVGGGACQAGRNHRSRITACCFSTSCRSSRAARSK